MRSVHVLVLTACSAASSAPNPDGSTIDREAARPAAARTVPSRPLKLGDGASTARVIEAHVLASIDDAPASDRPAYARADQHVTLHAAIVSESAGKRVVYSDAKAVVLGGKRLSPKPLANAPELELRWNRIEPAVATMSNGDTPSEFHFEPIDYRATPIDTATNAASISADVRPTLTPDYGHGVGTMRYQIVVLQGDRLIASPGPESRRGKGAGGVTDDVLRISIRRDDSYLGYLTEMYGQPYIWASAGLSDTSHESEHLEGSDCADFVVYGMRRLGKRLGYTWTGALPQLSSLLASGERAADGVYRDHADKPLPFTRIGDLVLFPRHVGVLALDRGTLGVLDDQDLMMHTLFDSPKEQAIGETSYADKPLELRRFR
ncbi:MAG: hypothetical protein H6Q90_6234 [Deltaproteobacteria bacterium]|nr:hypothetical protein [Deltaproteobacteria bacterium]